TSSPRGPHGHHEPGVPALVPHRRRQGARAHTAQGAGAAPGRLLVPRGRRTLGRRGPRRAAVVPTPGEAVGRAPRPPRTAGWSAPDRRGDPRDPPRGDVRTRGCAYGIPGPRLG